MILREKLNLRLYFKGVAVGMKGLFKGDLQ
jgi:hypothetical protein